jgi:hypothetical protein
MNYLRVYKETQITNSEMLNVLKTLGFKEVNGDPRDYRMENTEYDMYIAIPRRPLDENILKAFTASTSHLLSEFGVIEDFDDLVKMVLKERTKKRKEEKKQMAVMA